MPKTYPNLEQLAKEFQSKYADCANGTTACATIFDSYNTLIDIQSKLIDADSNNLAKLREVKDNLIILYLIANKMERGLERRKDFCPKVYRNKKTRISLANFTRICTSKIYR